MQMLRTIFMLMILAVVISGCAVAEKIVKPVPWGMETMPEGTPIFQAGWKEGCETGLATYGNDRYKMAYSFQQDPKMVLNDEYYRAWKESYVYCRWYAYNWVRGMRK